jgi:hypothetical protein
MNLWEFGQRYGWRLNETDERDYPATVLAYLSHASGWSIPVIIAPEGSMLMGSDGEMVVNDLRDF